jgi:hypothetical protein
MINLTIPEQAICPQTPDVLRALADWHDVQSTLADAMDCKDNSEDHYNRMLELLAEATRIEAEWER